ncbi:adenylate/guanylate cyclase domain-containing protein [Acidovorax delafieldii]|uniref:CHASE2 domain-containing protein n=1 Tax=Acidovorax delafieldii TaxID=47920 RepID=UPI00286BED5F|nr:adenylate/guanylate cyclase domain-containing protein [Acidovorax delafieldii]
MLGLALAASTWSCLWALAGGVLDQAQERIGDLVWRHTADRKPERRIVVVDVDERSLREIGPWPWPREQQAHLLDVIAAAGASQQILDIVFADSRPGDAVLAKAVQKHRPVLAQVFALEQGGQASAGQLAGALEWANCPPPFEQALGYLANTPALLPAAVGHITPRVSADGLVRHQPAVICHRDNSYPALGVAALMKAVGAPSLSIERGEHWLGPAWQLTSPQLVTGPVPLSSRGDLRIAWRQHPDSFVSLSAADVLAGRTPSGLLNNAWVLVGSSAFGLNDSIATPFNGASSGLQAHLQILTALIDGRTPYTPRAELAMQLGATLVGVALLLVLRYRPRYVAPRMVVRHHFPLYLLPLAATCWALLLFWGHAFLLIHHALWLGWLAPALFILFLGSAMGIVEHAKSRIDRDQLYTHLSSYLPAPVAAALALQPPSSAIRASTQQVSVLFADIRNFSAYCEARPPEEAAAVLHAFFSTATRVIERHGGVIEAFQGDAIIAVWNGTPMPATSDDMAVGFSGQSGKYGESQLSDRAPHHAQEALQAAVDLLVAMRGVLPDPAPAGLEPLSLGIGVETGLAMAGSFGLASRRTHMVMGRTVTIASRLVNMTAELSHPILVGEGLAGQVGGVDLESMGTFLLDGMRVPHHIYAYPLSADTSPYQ